MKKIVYSCLFSALFASSALADGGLLVGGGMALSNLSVSGDLKTDSSKTAKLSYNFLPGMIINYHYWYKFADNMGVIAGVSFESRGARVKTTTVAKSENSNAKLHYFTIPLYFTYTVLPEIVSGLVSDLSVSGGPEIGILCRINDEAPLEAIKALDYGVGFNCSVALFNMFALGAGYNLGLTNIVKVPKAATVKSSMKNSAIRLFVNYIHRAKS